MKSSAIRTRKDMCAQKIYLKSKIENIRVLLRVNDH